MALCVEAELGHRQLVVLLVKDSLHRWFNRNIPTSTRESSDKQAMSACFRHVHDWPTAHRSPTWRTVRRRPIVNMSEARAHRLLVRTLASTGWNVAIKPPVQAVLDKEHDELAMAEFRLYTQGHFDFAIYPEDEPLAAFAIEFDGFGHDRPDQIA